MKFKILLPLLALASFGFAVRHVVATGQEPPKQTPVVEPSRTPYKGALAGAGVVEPKSENIAIGSHLPGVVVEVFVNVGDQVQRDQPLFRLDDRHLQAEKRVREAMLASAKATFAKLKAMPRDEELPIAKAKVHEMQTLLADAREQCVRAERGARTGAVTEDDYARRKNAVGTAEAQLQRAEAELALLKEGAWKPDLAVAQAQIDMADAQLKQTITELERLTVRASVAGKILQKNLRPGEFVSASPMASLLVVGDVSTLHVRMDVDENDIGRFSPQLAGKAFTRGTNKRHFELQFVRVEPAVVPKKSLTGMGTERVDTRVLQVIYALQAPDAKLYVGQQMDIFLETAPDKR